MLAAILLTGTCTQAAQTAKVPVDDFLSLTLQPGESQTIALPADSPAFVEIHNDGIDTMASAQDAKGNSIWQAASWLGREGSYLLKLETAAGLSAQSIKLDSIQKYAKPGSVQFRWLYPDQGTTEYRLFENLALGTHHHLSSLSDSNSKSENYLLIAAQTAHHAKRPVYEAMALSEMGHVRISLDLLNSGLESFRAALNIYSKLDNQSASASSLSSLGLINFMLGQHNSAITNFQLALEIRERTNDLYYQAQTLNNLALTYWKTDDYATASDLYEEALLALVAKDDLSAAEFINLSNSQVLPTYELSMVAATLSNLALTKSSLGELDYAESAWLLARRLATTTGDQNRVAQIDQNLGNMYYQQGRLEQALDTLHQALAVHRERNNRYWLGETLTGIGNIYAAIGEHASALDYFQQTLDLNRDHQQQYANTLTQMAWSNWQLGNVALARQQFTQAHDSFADNQQPGAAAVVASKFAVLQHRSGERQQALHAQTESVAILTGLGHQREAARARSRLGQLLLAEGRLPEAQQQLQQALQGHREVGDELFELDTLTALSRAQTGDVALQSAKAAVQLAASLRDHSVSGDMQISFVASRRNAYEQYINLLTAQGDWQQAWLQNEQIRARSLASMMQQSGNHRPGALDQPPSLARLQQRLGEHNLLLSYFLGKERSHLWLIDGQGMHYQALPPAAQINALSAELTAALRQQRQSPARIAYLAEELSELVLQPVSDRLQGRALVIVPDGGLQAIPFAMLPLRVAANTLDQPTPLIASHSVSYTPSARIYSSFGRSQRKPAANILVLADPQTHDTSMAAAAVTTSADSFARLLAQRSANQSGINLDRLPGARLEAAAIEQLVQSLSSTAAIGTTLKLGQQASHSFVTGGALRNYDIIHFATHGIVDAEVPALSSLLLAQGDEHNAYLRPDDIAALQLDAGLVVLSGCETGIGKSVAGEGMMSLSRPFLIAGARQVVSSLWKVSDRATAELMQRFYFHLLQEGQPAEQALQSAQQWMHEQTQWQHPNFWAGFVISSA